MEKYGHIKLMHKGKYIDGRVKILESYVAPSTFTIGGTVIKQGTWLMGARIVDPQLWQDVKDGKFNGWSIGGTAISEPEETYTDLLTLLTS